MPNKKPRRLQTLPPRLKELDPTKRLKSLEDLKGEQHEAPEEKGEFYVSAEGEKYFIIQRRMASDEESGSS